VRIRCEEMEREAAVVRREAKDFFYLQGQELGDFQ
jgi:hypothetical protein